MDILITGVKGFIGGHLYWKLKGLGHNVVGIDNMSHPSDHQIPYEYADVRDYKALLPYFPECQAVFHLAAQISVDKSIWQPQETIDTNVLGTQNVLELARKYGTKVIFASSSEIYGTSQAEKMDENHPLDAQSPYGASKVAGDRLCLAYQKTFEMPINVVRNFNTFGEHQADDSYGGVISIFTKNAIAGQDLIIYGDGEQMRDYMHVSDAVSAYILALDSDFPPTNFGTGKTISINQLAAKIIEAAASKSKIVHGSPRRGEVKRLCADISKAIKLGFEPKTDLGRDLTRYVRWVMKK